MEFCLGRSLPHPGVVVLNSPLLAYYEPEDASDSLQGTDVKERFYRYLIERHKDGLGQVIIIENEHPPAVLDGRKWQ
jgi:hypothetical protein